jgi:hypothetical protein
MGTNNPACRLLRSRKSASIRTAGQLLAFCRSSSPRINRTTSARLSRRTFQNLLSFVADNWHSKPLISFLVIVQLIAGTTTDSGLTVACHLNENAYAKGIEVTDAEMAALNIQPAAFHGE